MPTRRRRPRPGNSAGSPQLVSHAEEAEAAVHPAKKEEVAMQSVAQSPWRWRVFAALFVGYALFTTLRKCLSLSMAGLNRCLHIQHTLAQSPKASMAFQIPRHFVLHARFTPSPQPDPALRHCSLILSCAPSSLGASTVQISGISSSFALAYAIFKLVGSVASDFAPPRALFAGSLLAAGLLSITFAVNSYGSSWPPPRPNAHITRTSHSRKNLYHSHL